MNMPKSRKQDSFLWILTRNCEGTEQLQKENNTMVPIAHIENNFPTKFGIPRQSGRVGALKARIVFEPEYRNVDACRGLEEFSHIWLIWEFSEAKRTKMCIRDRWKEKRDEDNRSERFFLPLCEWQQGVTVSCVTGCGGRCV